MKTVLTLRTFCCMSSMAGSDKATTGDASVERGKQVPMNIQVTGLQIRTDYTEF